MFVYNRPNNNDDVEDNNNHMKMIDLCTKTRADTTNLFCRHIVQKQKQKNEKKNKTYVARVDHSHGVSLSCLCKSFIHHNNVY